MISARGLSKVYRDGDTDVRVLEDLSLDIAAGEFVAVVGPSGSGKSTLLHVLGGLDVDYGGEIRVAGTSLHGLDDVALARFRNTTVGFVFQSFHLIPNVSALENVLLPAYFRREGAEVGDRSRRANEVLERVGLGGKTARSPSKLSGGERQRVAIARALFTDPKLLLCDEPTGNLDSATGAGIIELFSGLHREGMTIVTVTHEERLSAAAGRVLRLTDGRLAPEATTSAERGGAS